MNIVIEKQPLLDAVLNVSRAVGSKSSIPALEGILFQARGHSLRLTAYDLEMGILTDVDCQVIEPGEIILSSKLISDIVRKMPGDSMTISSDEKNLTLIKSGITEFTVLGLPADEFPEMPAISKEDSICLCEPMLKSMICQTMFACAQGDSKPVHTGVLFDIKDKIITLVAVDGYRLALRRESILTDMEVNFIVPSKTLSEIVKLLGDNDEQNVFIWIARKHIVVEMNGYQVITRLLEGEFLDYSAAIPTAHLTEVSVNTRAMAEAIERTALLINDRLKSPLKCHFEGDKLVLSCTTAIGKAYDELKLKKAGEDVLIGFNNRYLLDALKYSGCDEVRLLINGPLSPMRVMAPSGDSFVFLVLPVRLKNEN